MDLGPRFAPRQPECHRCPGSASALGAAGNPRRWPVTEAPKPLPFQVIGVGVVLNAAGDVLTTSAWRKACWEGCGVPGKQEQGKQSKIALP